jgi:GNAT superfamily N-acetyltransferase
MEAAARNRSRGGFVFRARGVLLRTLPRRPPPGRHHPPTSPETAGGGWAWGRDSGVAYRVGRDGGPEELDLQSALMLSTMTLDQADGYWAAFLGVPRERLRPSQPLLVAHAAGLEDYAGMYAQSFGGAAPVVSLPAALLQRFGGAAAEAAVDGLVDDGRWSRVFGGMLDQTVGPAEIRCTDEGTLRPGPRDARVRLLDAADRSALERLRLAVDAAEWEHGGSPQGAHAVAGTFMDGELAAVAGYQVWGGSLAHLGVITHPAHRGRGLGAAVVERVARAALEAGLVPQYRALASNAPSLRIADRLGFAPYAASFAVRLRVASTSGRE